MLKVLGSMLILLASVGFGFQIQMDLRNHLRLLYDIRKLLLDIVNETAYTMDPMEVVLEHAIHSRNPYLNEICKEMGEGLQKKERGCGQELWQERIEAWQIQTAMLKNILYSCFSLRSGIAIKTAATPKIPTFMISMSFSLPARL
jgi:stage III sporulation protein AB